MGKKGTLTVERALGLGVFGGAVVALTGGGLWGAVAGGGGGRSGGQTPGRGDLQQALVVPPLHGHHRAGCYRNNQDR